MHALRDWLLPSGFMPHGMCYLWRPDVLWLNVVSDGVIAASYFAIPLAIMHFVRRRHAVLPYWWIPALFAAFISLCGTTHVLGAWVVWHPDYVIDGLVKSVTAVVSAGTAFAVYLLLPQAMALRTPVELQQEVNQQIAELQAVTARLRQEIEARERADSALRDSEQRFRATFDNAAVGMAHVATDGRWLMVNDWLCDIVGYQRAELLARTFAEITHPDDIDKDWLYARRLLAGEIDTYSMEKRYLRRNGSVVWVLLTVALVRRADGSPHHFIATVADITDRKHAEEADRRLASVARLAALGELTAVVSHEINQPLTAILSNAEAADLLLQMEPPRVAEVRRILADIVRNDQRAGEVIRIVRDLTHRRAPELRPVSLNDVVESVVRLVSADAARRRVQLRKELADDLPLVLGDSPSLEQVLLNLVLNAMDAMQQIPESARQIVVSTRFSDGDSVMIAVEDRGHGIAPETMPRMFESFFTTKSEGMGIGLFTARSIVQAHRGRIWAENRATGGAVFHFSVPRLTSGDRDFGAYGMVW
jgi:PAS domain S-box-containing protein